MGLGQVRTVVNRLRGLQVFRRVSAVGVMGAVDSQVHPSAPPVHPRAGAGDGSTVGGGGKSGDTHSAPPTTRRLSNPAYPLGMGVMGAGVSSPAPTAIECIAEESAEEEELSADEWRRQQEVQLAMRTRTVSVVSSFEAVDFPPTSSAEVRTVRRDPATDVSFAASAATTTTEQGAKYLHSHAHADLRTGAEAAAAGDEPLGRRSARKLGEGT